MPDNTAPPSVSREHLQTTLRGLQHELAPGILADALNVLPQASSPPHDTRVPLEHVMAFHAALNDVCQDPLLTARAYSHLNYRPEFLRKTFLAGALGLDEAIALACRYIRVNSDLCSLRLEVARDLATVRILPSDSATGAREQLDAMVYSVSQTLLALGVSHIDRIELDHTPAPGLQHHYRQLFPAPVRFGQPGLAIRFSPDQLDHQLDWNTCPVEKLARRERRLRRLHPSHWQESVAVLIPPLYRRGEVQIDQCASLLAVSRRSLQRHIREEGATFRDLVDQSRRKLARNYLARGYSNEATAALLGYRQPAQFYRAFRDWFSCSPAEFRHQIPARHRPQSG